MSAKNSYKTNPLFNSCYSSIFKVSVTHWQTEVIVLDLQDKSQTTGSGKWIASLTVLQAERCWSKLFWESLWITNTFEETQIISCTAQTEKTRLHLQASLTVNKFISSAICCNYDKRKHLAASTSKMSSGSSHQQTATLLLQFRSRFLSQGWNGKDELSQLVHMNI